MTENISFLTADSHPCGGLLARSPSRKAVVVIQEWWGLNENIRMACERLAQAGYTTLAPDLYHGARAQSPQQAQSLMEQLDFAQAVQEIRASAQYLKSEGAESVAVLGFCLGGALALLTALQSTEFKSAVCFYGIPPKPAGDLSKIQIPVLGHFANADDWCTPASVAALESDFSRGHVTATIHRYDAQHAFANETRPEVYDADSSNLAWRRTFEFLSKTL